MRASRRCTCARPTPCISIRSCAGWRPACTSSLRSRWRRRCPRHGKSARPPDARAACTSWVSTGASLTSVAHTSWLFPYERVEIYGAHKTVVTEELERAWFSPGMRDQVEAVDCFQMPFEQKWGYAMEDRLFIDACLGARPPAVTAEDGYRATELVEACYQAVRSEQRVTLPLLEPKTA